MTLLFPLKRSACVPISTFLSSLAIPLSRSKPNLTILFTVSFQKSILANGLLAGQHPHSWRFALWCTRKWPGKHPQSHSNPNTSSLRKNSLQIIKKEANPICCKRSCHVPKESSWFC